MQRTRWNFDSNIYPGSYIERLPKALRRIALWRRNLSNGLKVKRYDFDGVSSSHNLSFLESEPFIAALQASIKAGGFDYRIYGRQHQAIFCSEMAIRTDPLGTFVELGTARGYMVATILTALKALGYNIDSTPFYCFDKFTTQLDKANQGPTDNKRNRYYASSIFEPQQLLGIFSNVTLVEGLLPETLKKQSLTRISFLHIDLNDAQTEIECLEALWDSIIFGGLVLIDDYSYRGYDNTTRLFNEFAKKNQQTILTTAYGQGIMIKSKRLS